VCQACRVYASGAYLGSRGSESRFGAEYRRSSSIRIGGPGGVSNSVMTLLTGRGRCSRTRRGRGSAFRSWGSTTRWREWRGSCRWGAPHRSTWRPGGATSDRWTSWAACPGPSALTRHAHNVSFAAVPQVSGPPRNRRRPTPILLHFHSGWPVRAVAGTILNAVS